MPRVRFPNPYQLIKNSDPANPNGIIGDNTFEALIVYLGLYIKSAAQENLKLMSGTSQVELKTYPSKPWGFSSEQVLFSRSVIHFSHLPIILCCKSIKLPTSKVSILGSILIWDTTRSQYPRWAYSSSNINHAVRIKDVYCSYFPKEQQSKADLESTTNHL